MQDNDKLEVFKKFYTIQGQIEFYKDIIKTLKWYQKVKFIIYITYSHYKYKFMNIYIRILNKYTMKVLKMILFK